MIPITKIISDFIIYFISSFGYLSIVFLMALESACIPIPSEVIMPFSGYLVYQGRFSLIGAAIAGTLGCVIGSIGAYAVGLYLGRPFILKYGKYVLVTKHKLHMADQWFERYGDRVIFISRLLPVIRTFISLPAGISRMNLSKFIVYTALGSFPWCLALAYVGVYLGPKWESILKFFHTFDALIIIALVVCAIVYIKKVREQG